MTNPISSAAKLVAFSCFALGALTQATSQQSSPPASQSPSPADAKTATPSATESPLLRLKTARTVWVTRAHGSNIPFDTIKSTLEGWIRFAVVDSPDKADIVVSVESSGDSDVQISTSAAPNEKTGHMDQSSKTSKDLSATDIKMTVLDAKSKRVLWTSTEKVKFAVKKTSRENNLVEAAERLATRFHDRLEPPPPPPR
ncbi:MAG: hypothetical protein LAO20_17085 [Acidobacteriia bacterium]|nr:hypothetical protein [Terriglobia bacterium]